MQQAMEWILEISFQYWRFYFEPRIRSRLMHCMWVLNRKFFKGWWWWYWSDDQGRDAWCGGGCVELIDTELCVTCVRRCCWSITHHLIILSPLILHIQENITTVLYTLTSTIINNTSPRSFRPAAAVFTGTVHKGCHLFWMILYPIH